MNIRSMINRALFAVTCLSAGVASAADLVISNARVFTATQSGVLENVTIGITGNRIELVSEAETHSSQATVIDARGKTVLPGLIDAHYHAFFDEGGAARPDSASEVESYIANRMPEKLNTSLQHGFTSLVSPIDFWPFIADVRDKVISGEIKGPRLFIAGGVFMSPGEHYVCKGSAWCTEHIAVQVKTADEARKGVASYAERGVDVIMYDTKTNAHGLVSDVAAALIDETHKRGLHVLVHGVDAKYLSDLVSLGVDGLVQPPNITRDDDGSLLGGAVGKGLPLGITARSDDLTHHNSMLLLKGGAVPVFASDMPGAGPEEILPRMFEVLAEYELNNEQILLAATRNAAQDLLGKKDLGTIEPGQLADMIIVDGNPLNDLSALLQVVVVIKDGEVVVDNR